MIAKINNPILRRVSLVLSAPLWFSVVLLAYAFVLVVSIGPALWDATVDFWEGFPEALGGSLRAAWNGTAE